MIMLQLLILFIIFVGVIFFMFRTFFRRDLDDALMRLKNLQKEGEIKEAQLKKELERAKEMRAFEVEKGKNEAKALIEETKKEGLELRIRIEEEAKAKAQRIIQQGKEDLEKVKSNLFSEIEDEALHLSLEMVKYAFTETGRENLQRQFINELMPDIEKIKEEQITEKTPNVRVVSSFPLSESHKSRLKQVLSKKIGVDVSLKEEVNSELIAGFIIHVGALIIDGSLKNKLNKIMPYIKGKEG